METPKSTGQWAAQAGQLLRGLTLSQRLLLVGGAVAVAATLWVFVGWMSKPKYVTLYSGLNAQEAQQLASRLAAANVAYELSTDNAVLSVPADQLDAARLKTASEGLPRNARLGFEIFDTPNWAGSDFTDKVNYQRALEGELERTIESLSEVESVRVHLVMPEDSLFGEPEHEAKAAVIVKTKGGALSEQARTAIPQLVASAVDRLRAENVTLVDADTNTPLLRGGRGQNTGALDLEQELAKKILLTLDPVVGAEHVRASVHVEYDPSSSENTDEIYDPKAVATLTQQKSDETAGGGAPSGVAGTASNTPGVTPPTVTAASDNQSSRSESETFAVSKSVRHRVDPPGRIRRIAAAVLVDDFVDSAAGKTPIRRKRTAEELKQFEQLASAAIGLDTQRNDSVVVENLSFQEIPLEKPTAPSKIARARRILVEWSGVLRYAGVTLLFLLVYLMMLRPIKKQILVAFREIPARLEKPAKEPPKATLKGPAEVEIDLPQGAEQGQLAAALKRQLTEKVQSEPSGATRLIQSWIREDA